MRSSAARRKVDQGSSIASAVAASAAVLPAAEIGPSVQPLDLDAICRLISQPAWNGIGFHTRLAFAFLDREAGGTVDTNKTVAELLEQKDEPLFEDTLVKMSHTRVALIEIAAMMKVSISKQWKAVDSYLVAKGHSATQADDDLCGDDELLALRPAFEAGRARMKAATAEVAKAERRHPNGGPKLDEAYAVQSDAVDADSALVTRVTALRARTKEGIRFKREVRAYWQDCEQSDLDASIFNDLLAYVDTSP